MTDQINAPIEAEVDTRAAMPDSINLDEPEVLEPEEPAIEDDHEEVERDGQKYRIPKALKGELLMQADYTKKTQSLAEERKVFEQERQYARQVNEEMLNARAQVMFLDQQLQQYSQVDWQTLSAQDPLKAQQLWIDYSQMKDKRQGAAATYSQAEQQLQLKAQQEFAKRAEETRSAIQRDVKDWGPELEKNLVSFAKTLGYPDQQIQMALATDAASVKLLHMAYQFNQTLKNATKPPQVAKIDPKPVTKVSGVARATKEPADMTDKEFAEWRRRQIAQRR
jgi:hypothetical protein